MRQMPGRRSCEGERGSSDRLGGRIDGFQKRAKAVYVLRHVSTEASVLKVTCARAMMGILVTSAVRSSGFHNLSATSCRVYHCWPS
jgi:hypothetical protein